MWFKRGQRFGDGQRTFRGRQSRISVSGIMLMIGFIALFLAVQEFSRKGMLSWFSVAACIVPLLTLPLLIRRDMKANPLDSFSPQNGSSTAVVPCHVCEGRGALRCKVCNGEGDCDICHNRRFYRCHNCDGTGVEAKRF